ncbi:MAG: 2-oxoacid:acceptor oxidoreductase subunit alpha [Candidatus Magasanikbacteria bacterium]|nr:2-oxoacid:acceptor oxidoreductase subunit alpha [Candidatus Magasanikbacteria bacterium]
MSPFTFKIGGAAGFGIMSTGLTFSKLAARSGYQVFDYAEYPSLIRGGHNVMQTTVADKSVNSPRRSTNLLVALNQETVARHYHELTPGATLLYDKELVTNVADVPNGVHLIAVPLQHLAKAAGGTILMRNTVALGASVALLGGKLTLLVDLINEEFAAKSPEIKQKNQTAALAGYDYLRANYPNNITPILAPRRAPRSWVITGNEAAGLGALSAGMQFAAIYPMTPTSNILHFLAPLQPEFNFICQQPEDEIAAINLAIGASFAGARAMVATAGGGFSLMVEGYGLAGMTETPLVIIEGMRPGPATGLPTWTGQADLRFLLHAHQDEFPRLVLAPGDPQETFNLTRQAFNLAEIYQTPVVILLDKYLCESHWSAPDLPAEKFKIERGKLITRQLKNYRRYALSAEGISPRALPGSGNHILANSDEHNEAGYSEESAENRQQQMEKRMKKLVTCANNHLPSPRRYGPPEASTTIISWGSTKGPILDALPSLPDVNFIHLTWLNPFPAAALRPMLKSSQRVINIENNYSGQLQGLIAETTGISLKENLLKYDGRPFYPEEIIEFLTA